MKDPELLPARPRDRRGLQSVMTARLAARQLGLLFLAATALLFVCFFINYYGQATFWSVWNAMDPIQYKFIAIHPLLLLIYGYVFFNGLLFALGPSERSFGLFFSSMIFALLVANYDNSIIDWFLTLFGGVTIRIVHRVHPMKILFAGLFFLAVIAMHYNILSDDFARRMLRRGVPTEEVAQVRPGMFKVMVPTVLTAGVVAFGLSLLGWFSSFVFQDNPLHVSKLELFLLAALLVPMAFLLRGILRDLVSKRSGNQPPGGPNR
jgi:hypothetical protein